MTPGAGPAPVIVSAVFAAPDLAWLDALRRAHFPPERNVLPAHLTLFHHLPPAILPELRQRLTAATRAVAAPRARVAGPMSLGRGVALRIESPELEAIRAELAAAFAPLLMPQDRAGWRPHVTIQNKVEPQVARALKTRLEAEFESRPVAIKGLATAYYRDGPWEAISRHMFA